MPRAKPPVRRVGALLVSLVLLAAAPDRLASQHSGITEAWVLEHRAYDVPRGAPTLIAHAPPSFDPSSPFEIVLFFHGWSGCVNVLMSPGRVPCVAGGAPRDGWDLSGAFDRANRNAILLAPQLAWRTRNGHPGRLLTRGYTRAMVDEAMSRLRDRMQGRGVPDAAGITLVAHSAGFLSAIPAMRQGGLGPRLTRVVLMDALYDAPSAFLSWVLEEPERSLVSIHTGGGRTRAHSLRVLEGARQRLGASAVAEDPPDLREAVRSHRVVVLRTHVGHSEVPARYFPEVLDRAGDARADQRRASSSRNTR